MADKSIIDRIKKLLALASDNPNKAEATAAALKAQKLIADNDVSKAELYEDEPEEIIEHRSADIKGNPWSKRLARVIADNFRCKHYIHSHYGIHYYGGKYKTDEKIVFVGYDTDAQAATVTFDRLREIGKRLANDECRKARQTFGSASGVKNSFLMGFVDGIRTELEKQSVALVLVRPKAVDDYYDEISVDFGTDRSTIRNAYRNGSYDNGVSAGRDSVRSARLAGQAALTA